MPQAVYGHKEFQELSQFQTVPAFGPRFPHMPLAVLKL